MCHHGWKDERTMASPLPDRAISHRLQIVNIMIYCKSGFDVWCKGVEEAMRFSCPADLIGFYVAVSSLLIMRRMSSSNMIGMELNTNDKQTKKTHETKTRKEEHYIYIYICIYVYGTFGCPSVRFARPRDHQREACLGWRWRGTSGLMLYGSPVSLLSGPREPVRKLDVSVRKLCVSVWKSYVSV